ncbi:hypothetical protein D3C72_2143580 [compost metagenome]
MAIIVSTLQGRFHIVIGNGKLSIVVPPFSNVERTSGSDVYILCLAKILFHTNAFLALIILIDNFGDHIGAFGITQAEHPEILNVVIDFEVVGK